MTRVKKYKAVRVTYLPPDYTWVGKERNQILGYVKDKYQQFDTEEEALTWAEYEDRDADWLIVPFYHFYAE